MESESTFVAPEGVYSVTEEHKPVLLPVHTANVTPNIYPTRLSSVTVRFPHQKQGSGSPGFAQFLGGNKDKDKEAKKGASTGSGGGKEDGVSQSSSDTAPDDEIELPPTAGPEQRTLFSQANSSRGKRHTSRPRHNIKTTSSTFITRVSYMEGHHRIIQGKQGDATFVFYNAAKTFYWLEAGIKAKESLAKVTFSSYPTCHDVNTFTAAPDHLDVIIGFASGDLVWFDPISQRYGRLNKSGCITNSACTAVHWVPSSPTLFIVSFADGTILVFDKERDDGSFTPNEPTGSSESSDDSLGPKEWNPLDNIFVTMPPWHPMAHAGSAAGKNEKDKAAKNPVSHWKVSKRGIVDFAFSPDVKYVGAISEDGCLRVIDALAESLVDCYASYFGALTCVTWSPDGRYILTGGQDDLLTIISPWEQRVVARCQGHSSFVSSVAFDELRCDGRTYRFGSVGEDNKLILWDFSSGAIHRPKFQPTHHQKVSMASTLSLAYRRSALHLPSLVSPGTEDRPLPRYHPAPSRTEIAVVQPVLIKHIDSDLLTSLLFLPRSLLTANKSGYLKLWIRPLAPRPRPDLKGRRAATDIL